MDDIEQRLARLGQQPLRPVSEVQVRADLEAARSARRARRTRRASLAALALVVVAGVGAAVPIVTDHDGSGHGSGEPTTVRLVDYTGAQQPGFTVRTVPAGYVLQGASRGVLAIAAPGDHTSIYSFVHKLVITVEAAAEYPPPRGAAVVVQGHAGAIRSSVDGVTTLEWVDGPHLVQVQEWNDIGLTREQLIAFADGVTVTTAAMDSHG